MGEIVDEHPFVAEIRDQSLGLTRGLPIDIASEAGLLKLANRLILHIVQFKGAYRCIGSLQLFRVLRTSLPPDAIIPAIVHERLSPAELKDHIMVDLLVVPVLYTIHPRERSRFGDAWARKQNIPLLQCIFSLPVMMALSKLMGCDVRTLKGKSNEDEDEDRRAEE
jgi:hypothetical protein